MLTITLRDIQWRARRFALGAIATALVFAATLLLAGLHAAFINEATDTVASFNAARWMVPAGVSGPFTQNVPLSAGQQAEVPRLPGVVRATPIVLSAVVVEVQGQEHNVDLIGYPPGGAFAPRITAGRAPRASDEVAVDRLLHLAIGSLVSIEGRRLRVVGQVSGLTYNVGTPALLMTLGAARRLVFGGEPQASAVITRGVPRSVPAGLRAMRNAAVVADLRRPLSTATSAIEVLAVLLFVVAIGVIGLMVYLSSLDRLSEFAVYKAVGVSSTVLLGSLVLQTMAFALLAAALAVLASVVMAPRFPIPVSIGAGLYAALFGAALLVGLAASAVGIRQITRVDPAVAFAGRGGQ
ncbi:MAG TPA: ABC transporter permease [Solirubrobacteraceae bacterium]|jgi:putative ABC transport system permease protein|nr:ABC transporter permease [Solirubrobacteraceae bacterium]